MLIGREHILLTTISKPPRFKFCHFCRLLADRRRPIWLWCRSLLTRSEARLVVCIEIFFQKMFARERRVVLWQKIRFHPIVPSYHSFVLQSSTKKINKFEIAKHWSRKLIKQIAPNYFFLHSGRRIIIFASRRKVKKKVILYRSSTSMWKILCVIKYVQRITILPDHKNCIRFAMIQPREYISFHFECGLVLFFDDVACLKYKKYFLQRGSWRTPILQFWEKHCEQKKLKQSVQTSCRITS